MGAKWLACILILLVAIAGIAYMFPAKKSGETIMLQGPASGESKPSPRIYVIQPTGTYEFETYIASETEAKHIVFHNASGTNGTLDNVWVEGNKIYMNTTDSAKSLNIMLEYMTDTWEISTNLTGIRFAGDKILVIEVTDWARINESDTILIKTRNKA